ncbi:30S ribosomal protein S20 [Candidatus Dojkabacteria bacterium]|nr:30S ribosomal protein S20 [Candidatus Dojkabacteria bacterium]
MANLKSSKKDIRRTKRRTTYNNRLRGRIRRAEKSFVEAIEAKDSEKAKTAFDQVQKVVDKAAKKGVIKKNTASRKKSRMAASLNKLVA